MKIVIFGASGMLGQNLLAKLKLNTAYQLFFPTRQELNLLDKTHVFNYIKNTQPDLILNLAARVGGIQANISEPVLFLSDNLSMGLNVVLGALENGVEQLINIGSSCIYPRDREILSENDLLTGSLEPTNEGYALAKISIMRLCEYIQQQYGFNYKTIIPPNLYGPHDHFDLIKAHMIPAAIHKLHLAKINHDPEITIWGNGEARREFMYIEDLVDFLQLAITRLTELPAHLNVGLGYDYTVNEYYQFIRETVGYEGEFIHDLTKAAGMKKKLLDSSLAIKLFNWKAATPIQDGLQKTYHYFLKLAPK